jgi:hypothetical protein
LESASFARGGGGMDHRFEWDGHDDFGAVGGGVWWGE